MKTIKLWILALLFFLSGCAADPFAEAIDADGDGYESTMDCNDLDAAINPGSKEIYFNGIDDNCNGQVDEGSFIAMADGKTWTTRNLDLVAPGYEDETWWYNDQEHAYRDYGRLYTRDAAEAACKMLGEGWRLPTDKDWQDLITAYDGNTNINDNNRVACAALRKSPFEALLCGCHGSPGIFSDLDQCGLYWSSTVFGEQFVCFYAFNYDRSLIRVTYAELWGASCRCVREGEY